MFLAPVVLWLAWRYGPPLGVRAALLALVAVLLAMTPSWMCLRLAPAWEATQHGDFLPLMRGNSGLLWLFVALLVCAEPRRLGRTDWVWALIGVVAGGLAVLGEDPVRIQAFWFDSGLLSQSEEPLTAVDPQWVGRAVAAIGMPAQAPLWVGLPLAGLAVLGARQLWLRRRASPESTLLAEGTLVIVLCTAPPGLYTIYHLGAALRYLVPVMLVFALLVAKGCQDVLSRAAWARWASLFLMVVVLMPAPEVPAPDSSRMLFATWRSVERLAAATNLGPAELRQQVHGILRNAPFADGHSSVQAFAVEVQPPRQHSQRHWRLTHAGTSCAEVDGGLCAIAYTPRVQSQATRLAQDGGQSVAAQLPFHMLHLASGQRPPSNSWRTATGTSARQAAQHPLRLQLMLEGNATPSLDEVVVLVEPENNQRPCHVRLSGQEVGGSGPGGWIHRFAAPAGPAQLELQISDCDIANLDVFDGAHADVWTPPAQRPSAASDAGFGQGR